MNLMGRMVMLKKKTNGERPRWTDLSISNQEGSEPVDSTYESCEWVSLEVLAAQPCVPPTEMERSHA